jgi:hypothetical protein
MGFYANIKLFGHLKSLLFSAPNVWAEMENIIDTIGE